jgi:hypothetical protein
MVETPFAPETVNSADGRITIPQRYCEKMPWVSGKDPLLVWLLMLVPGRFRMLSDLEVQQDVHLRGIRSVIVDGPTELGSPATAFEPSERAAIIGRLTPTTLFPPRPSWRLMMPKHILLGYSENRTFVLLFSSGYVEIWLPDVYSAALAPPLDSVI